MNYFFDTSALVKIYHSEENSQNVLKIYNNREDILIISELAKVEYYSTIYRKYREKLINKRILTLLIEKFDYDTENRFEVLYFSSGVTEQAQDFLKEFGESRGLKALDSLQIGFFRFFCDEEDVFVCFDDKLKGIAKDKNINVFP